MSISVLFLESSDSCIHTAYSVPPLGCQLCILKLRAQDWTNFLLKLSVFINWLPSSLHTGFPISVDGIFIHPAAQAKNIGIKFPLLFLTSHILYPLGNPEGSIFTIYSGSKHFSPSLWLLFWSQPWHLLSWIFNRFLTHLSASSLPIFSQQSGQSDPHKIQS